MSITRTRAAAKTKATVAAGMEADNVERRKRKREGGEEEKGKEKKGEEQHAKEEAATKQALMEQLDAVKKNRDDAMLKLRHAIRVRDETLAGEKSNLDTIRSVNIENQELLEQLRLLKGDAAEHVEKKEEEADEDGHADDAEEVTEDSAAAAKGKAAKQLQLAEDRRNKEEKRQAEEKRRRKEEEERKKEDAKEKRMEQERKQLEDEKEKLAAEWERLKQMRKQMEAEERKKAGDGGTREQQRRQAKQKTAQDRLIREDGEKAKPDKSSFSINKNATNVVFGAIEHQCCIKIHSDVYDGIVKQHGKSKVMDNDLWTAAIAEEFDVGT
jgi:hypothetical protein